MAVKSVASQSVASQSVASQSAASQSASAANALNAEVNMQNVQATKKAEQARAASQNGYARAARRSESGAAEVSISPKARELATASRILRETPDVREEKVEHFKKLIESGEYKADAGKIADGMMREAIKDELSATPEIALQESKLQSDE